jgi:hypothetical protein
MCHIFALSKVLKVSNINFAHYRSAKGHNASSLPTTIVLETIARVSEATLSLLTYLFTMIPNTWWISVCSPNAHIHATMIIEHTIIMCM